MSKPATIFDRFYYGVCYYPEAWDAKRHASDLDRIRDAGFNLVRIGEGAWSYFEPSESRYRFDLFDRVIDLCRARGLKVIFGTPTYTGPAWIAHQYPEVLRWTFERLPMKHGSRRNYNYTSPKYYELSDGICTALAEHYKGEKQIIGWQLDNEFNCHSDTSYAPSDTIAFRQWLQNKYKSLDALNRAWGTTFWSQTYTDWEQIDLPHPSACYLNPSVLLDESRFISDCVVRFAKRQADILRRANDGWFITHNGLFGNVKGPDLAGVLDVFAHDQYPLFYNSWTDYAFPLVQSRSLTYPFMILEQQSGPGGQMAYFHRTPRPGEMRLWAWQTILHGAQALSYFRWRTCPYGTEQHWHGLIDADDRDTRRLAEAKQLGDEARKLPKAFFSLPMVKSVAVLRDFDNETNDRRINTYMKHGAWESGRWQTAFARRHVPVDMLWPTSDFVDYRLIVAPHLKIVDAKLVAKYAAFVKAGGVLVLGAQSGTKDENCHIVEKTAPGLLRQLAGVEVQDWSVVPEKQSFSAEMRPGVVLQLDTFVERLRPRGAKTLARWTGADTLLGDAPAVTINQLGKGYVVYVGGYAPLETANTLVDYLMRECDIEPLVSAPAEVESVARAGSKRYLCLMNHSGVPQEVTHFAPGKDLISGDRTSGSFELPPFGVAIVEQSLSRRK